MNNNLLLDSLTELIGDGVLIPDTHGYSHYTHPKLHVGVFEKDGSWLVSVDLKSCFNKESQSPLHFIVDGVRGVADRKKKRIVAAIQYLIANEKIAGGFFGRVAEYDDLDASVRGFFYIHY